MMINPHLKRPLRSVDDIVGPPRFSREAATPNERARIYRPGDEGYEEALARFGKRKVV